MNDNNTLQIFDTTLRDGEQSPGISLNTGEKLKIAEQLEKLGVDVIEAGFPVASIGDFEAVQAIAKKIKKSTVCGLCRTSADDIERCYEAIEPAPKKRIHTFIATSEAHMEHKLRMTHDEVRAETARAVSHAISHVGEVEFSPEDGSRSDFDFMCEILQIAVDNGATILNIPDTVGFAVPTEYAKTLTEIQKRVKGNYILSTHCHNDLGLAVANSLAGVMAGARQVECAVNGIGERAGNAALEEIVMAVKTREDYFQNINTNINTAELFRTSRLVSHLTGYLVQHNKAIVGRNAFAHESGIHQAGVLRKRDTYEIMDPKDVGQKESKLVMGKHSGRMAFKKHVEKMGFEIEDGKLEIIFKHFKDLADKKKEVSDIDIEAIIADKLADTEKHYFELIDLKCSGGTNTISNAYISVKTMKDGMVFMSSQGDGMIDATCQAIKLATNTKGRITDYTVGSLTDGSDALGGVSLRFVSDDGIETSGRAFSTDVVEASAKAFINALNKLKWLQEKGLSKNDIVRPGKIDY